MQFRFRFPLLPGICLFALALAPLSVSRLEGAPIDEPLLPNTPQSTAAGPVSPFAAGLFTTADNPTFGLILDQAKAFGVRYAVAYLDWWRIQPLAPTPITAGCGNCNWSYADLLMNQLTSRGLQPYLILGGSPQWASTHSQGPIDQPGGVTAFANFAGALAARYPNIRYFGMFGEPDDWNPGNTDHGWGGRGADYATMLKSVYPAIHNANPNALVVSGGLAYENWGCPGFPNDQCFDMNFIQEVLDNGGGPYFDVMDYHFYDAFRSYYTPPTIIGKALKLEQNFPGLHGKPLVLTEMGTSYYLCGNPAYTHENASRAIVMDYAQWLSGQDAAYGLQVQIASWFQMEHYDQFICTPDFQSFGLLQTTLQPWPTEQATYQTVVQELDNSRYEYALTGVPDVEGYQFTVPAGQRTVLWSTNPSGQNAGYSVQRGAVRVRQKTGQFSTIVDGGPGDLDARPGWIGVSVTPSPIYLEGASILFAPALCSRCP